MGLWGSASNMMLLILAPVPRSMPLAQDTSGIVGEIPISASW